MTTLAIIGGLSVAAFIAPVVVVWRSIIKGDWP